jgi:hypothetical protein
MFVVALLITAKISNNSAALQWVMGASTLWMLISSTDKGNNVDRSQTNYVEIYITFVSWKKKLQTVIPHMRLKEKTRDKQISSCWELQMWEGRDWVKYSKGYSVLIIISITCIYMLKFIALCTKKANLSARYFLQTVLNIKCVSLIVHSKHIYVYPCIPMKRLF